MNPIRPANAFLKNAGVLQRTFFANILQVLIVLRLDLDADETYGFLEDGLTKGGFEQLETMCLIFYLRGLKQKKHLSSNLEKYEEAKRFSDLLKENLERIERLKIADDIKPAYKVWAMMILPSAGFEAIDEQFSEVAYSICVEAYKGDLVANEHLRGAIEIGHKGIDFQNLFSIINDLKYILSELPKEYEQKFFQHFGIDADVLNGKLEAYESKKLQADENPSDDGDEPSPELP